MDISPSEADSRAALLELDEQDRVESPSSRNAEHESVPIPSDEEFPDVDSDVDSTMQSKDHCNYVMQAAERFGLEIEVVDAGMYAAESHNSCLFISTAICLNHLAIIGRKIPQTYNLELDSMVDLRRTVTEHLKDHKSRLGLLADTMRQETCEVMEKYNDAVKPYYSIEEHDYLDKLRFNELGNEACLVVLAHLLNIYIQPVTAADYTIGLVMPNVLEPDRTLKAKNDWTVYLGTNDQHYVALLPVVPEVSRRPPKTLSPPAHRKTKSRENAVPKKRGRPFKVQKEVPVGVEPTIASAASIKKPAPKAAAKSTTKKVANATKKTVEKKAVEKKAVEKKVVEKKAVEKKLVEKKLVEKKVVDTKAKPKSSEQAKASKPLDQAYRWNLKVESMRNVLGRLRGNEIPEFNEAKRLEALPSLVGQERRDICDGLLESLSLKDNPLISPGVRGVNVVDIKSKCSVVAHTILIDPGYTYVDTEGGPVHVTVIGGNADVRLSHEGETKRYPVGSRFDTSFGRYAAYSPADLSEPLKLFVVRFSDVKK